MRRARLDRKELHAAVAGLMVTVPGPGLPRFFNGLNFHSVHHAFPRVPFPHLAEAHRRVAKICEDAGAPLPVGHGYARTLVALARAPALLGGESTVEIRRQAG